MKSKATIAVCGLMDSGKSTLIKSLLRKNTGRVIEPDALCIEQATAVRSRGPASPAPSMTIPIWSSVTAPGIWNTFRKSCRAVASRGYILIIDENRREQSEAYQRKLGEIAAAIGVENIAVVHSHSMEEQTEQIHYDTEQPSFDAAMDRLLEIMDRFLRKEHQVPPDESRVVWFDFPGRNGRSRSI